MSGLPDTFPELPGHPNDDSWSYQVIQGHSVVSTAYAQALTIFHANDNDAHRVRLHADRLLNRIAPVLQAMEPAIMNTTWILTAADVLGALIVALDQAAIAIDTVYVRFQFL